MTAVLFDLDNTLYDASQYFLGAFSGISNTLSEKYGLKKALVYEKLIEIWKKETSMYPRLFDDLLSFLKISATEVQNLIKQFNEYEGKLEPYPDAIPTLRILKERGYKLGVITDGDPDRQKRKIKMLGLSDFFDVVVYAKESGSKKSVFPYLMALERLNENPRNSFYVADNPLADFEGAKKAGLTTIRILRGEFANISSGTCVDYQIKNLAELIEIVEERNEKGDSSCDRNQS